MVNPKGEAKYQGPTATVRGVVKTSGDPPPEQTELLAKIPDGCAGARSMYQKLFREGPDRELADVLVAVTGYSGYVPAKRSVREVRGSGCAWDARTVAVTFGQRIDVVAADRRAYVPQLLGERMAAQLIAMPGGSGSSLYPKSPGRFVLIDSMRLYSTAEVLVLKYSTFDVTGPDGVYEISGIPAGKVKLNAILPATGQSVERSLDLSSGKTESVDLEILFDLAAFQKAASSASSASPDASAPAP